MTILGLYNTAVTAVIVQALFIPTLFAQSTETTKKTKKKIWYTHLNQGWVPKAKDPLDFSPAIHMPENIDDFSWELSQAFEGGKETGTGGIPVFKSLANSRRFVPDGLREAGRPIIIKAVRTYKHVHYYGFIDSSSQNSPEEELIWVSGYYVKAKAKTTKAN